MRKRNTQSRDREGSNAHRRATEAGRIQYPAELRRQLAKKKQGKKYDKKKSR